MSELLMMDILLKVIGAALVSSPFVVLAVIIYKKDGWKTVFFVFGFAFFIVAVVFAGIYLLYR